MNTSPSIDDMLEGLIVALAEDILPNVTNMKAAATAVMAQSMLQGIRQLLPVMDLHLADEHNAMTDVLRRVSTQLADVDGAAAARIRERGANEGQWPDVPLPPPRQPLVDAHRSLGEALVATLRDLDELQRAGVPVADEALDTVRGHFGPRYERDVATFVMAGGMVGRG